MGEREEIRGNVQVYNGLAKALFKTIRGEVLLEDEQEKLEQWLQESEEHREFYAFFHDPCNLSDVVREHWRTNSLRASKWTGRTRW